MYTLLVGGERNMAYKNKVRVSVPLSPEIDERVVNLANKMGMSKSSLCAYLIAQQLDTYELSISIMQDPLKLKQFQDMMNIATDDHLSNMSKESDEKK